MEHYADEALSLVPGNACMLPGNRSAVTLVSFSFKACSRASIYRCTVPEKQKLWQHAEIDSHASRANCDLVKSAVFNRLELPPTGSLRRTCEDHPTHHEQAFACAW